MLKLAHEGDFSYQDVVVPDGWERYCDDAPVKWLLISTKVFVLAWDLSSWSSIFVLLDAKHVLFQHTRKRVVPETITSHGSNAPERGTYKTYLSAFISFGRLPDILTNLIYI